MPDFDPLVVDRLLQAFLAWKPFVTSCLPWDAAKIGLRLIDTTQTLNPLTLWRWAASSQAGYDHDWRDFVRSFDLPKGGLPDSGRVRVALHNFIDEVQGREPLRWGY